MEAILMKKNKFVSSVAKKAGISYEAAYEKMKEVKKNYGISFRYYDEKNLQWANKIRFPRFVKRFQNRIKRRDERLERMGEKLHLSKAEIKEQIGKFREAYGCSITVAQYENLKIYAMSEEEKEHLTALLLRKERLETELKKEIRRIKVQEKTPAECEEKIKEYKKVLGETMSDVRREALKTIVLEKTPEMQGEELENRIQDIEATNYLLHFPPKEYQLFNLNEFEFLKRRKFVNENDGKGYLQKLNEGGETEIVDDKYEAYKRLQKYYRRKAMLIDSDDCKEEFIEFCKKRKQIMKKPISSSWGRGIEKINLEEHADYEKLFYEFREQADVILIEDVIIQNRKMAKFNEDSVNTVRVSVYQDGEKVTVYSSLLRTGQKGTLVDNTGAGGLFAAIDIRTGTIMEDAVDGKGTFYKEHPQSGVPYRGFQIPRWRSLMRLVVKLTKEFPDHKIMGWDFVYTNHFQWAVVEVNNYPEFAFQAATKRGAKNRFLKLTKVEQQ